MHQAECFTLKVNPTTNTDEATANLTGHLALLLPLLGPHPPLHPTHFKDEPGAWVSLAFS